MSLVLSLCYKTVAMAQARRCPAICELPTQHIQLFEEEDLARALWTEEQSGKYDVLISYNSRDEAAVVELTQRPRKVWTQRFHLSGRIPGRTPLSA